MAERTLEDEAADIAAYAGLRWCNLDEAGRQHYRRQAETERARQQVLRERQRPYEPPLMPPFF